MPDPIYTYTALAFVVGVVVGIGLSKAILYRAEKTLMEANWMLSEAIDKADRATAFYQEAARLSNQTNERVKQLRQEVADRA